MPASECEVGKKEHLARIAGRGLSELQKFQSVAKTMLACCNAGDSAGRKSLNFCAVLAVLLPVP